MRSALRPGDRYGRLLGGEILANGEADGDVAM
jgi:hypothetical protein